MLGPEDKPTEVDPLSLDTIEQAIFILERFEKGATTIEIIEAIKEASVAQAHFLYFTQMGWIEQRLQKWHLTDEGINNLAILKEKKNHLENVQ